MHPPDSKNPSLRKYFKYMVISRKLTIQFSQRKIRDIIRIDLGIDLNIFSDLLQTVSIEAFAYYMQAWPGWLPESFQQCIDNSDDAFAKFKTYLREKILHLKLKEQQFLLLNKNKIITDSISLGNNILIPPNNLLDVLPTYPDIVKIKLPYTLEVSANSNLLNAMCFQDIDDKIVLHFKKFDIGSELTISELLNHPFVSVDLNVPALIQISRKNVHRIEMFLCKPSDSWSFPVQEHIIDVQKSNSRNNIYTWKFMQHLFMKLIKVISDYDTLISQDKKNEIKDICNEFLHDIKEANLNFTSIQESTDICYNIGKSMYYSDTFTSKDEKINFRKIFSPQMVFMLNHCSIVQDDILPDGSFKYFDFHKNFNKSEPITTTQLSFVNYIRNSIKYMCTLCNVPYDNVNFLKLHLRHTHPCEGYVKCTKCNKDIPLHNLLTSRWRHECNPSTE